MIELRTKESSLDAQNVESNERDLCSLVDELQYAPDTLTFIGGLHVLVEEMRNTTSAYIGATSELLDRPSVRILKRINHDLDDMIAWYENVLAACPETTSQNNAEWLEHIRSLLRAIGGVDGSAERCQRPVLRCDQEGPRPRQIDCARDERFRLFAHTRQNEVPENLMHLAATEYDRRRLDLIRTQRDEIDAIETFANVLHDLPDPPFDLVLDLARFVSDEARHAEIGHQCLESLAVDPFSVPCGTIGIAVRSPMPPLLAFAQISIFGELNIVEPMRRLAKDAYAIGDFETGRVFDFVHADEIVHLLRGRAWLKKLHPSRDLSELKEEARMVACRRLVEEGIIGEEYAMNLSSQEIAEIIGGE